ncbi:MAG TPA: MFS transporter [Candidatus Limnocylindrales bacterium]|jgi:sugar phosphate permease|nr:MFS transporter [Candidatus Limnocylindrales bacterium]
MRRAFFYGWVVVAVTAIVVLITAGVRSAPGAFLLTMTAEPGWSTASVSFAAAAGLIVFGFAGPISGWLMGRIGVKNVVLLSLAVTGASLLATSLVREIWQLTVLFGLVSGLGTGLVASVLGPTVATRWFVKDRGLVVGIFGASNSAGQLIFFPVLTAMSVAAGWRLGAIVLGVISLALVVPVLIWLRNDPADVGARPRGATEGAIAHVRPPDGGVMRRAVRTSDFWFLAGTFFICGATSNGLVGQHFIPHAVDHGFTAVAASGALAVMGVFNFIGTIGSGWLTDRLDPRKLLLVYYAFRGVSLLFLPLIHDTMTIAAFAILFGLDYIATVPPTVALVADRFGQHNVGVVYGWVFASHMVGAAIAAWVAGIVRENVGDYAVAFVAAGWIAIVAGFAALAIRRTSPDSDIPVVAAPA